MVRKRVAVFGLLLVACATLGVQTASAADHYYAYRGHDRDEIRMRMYERICEHLGRMNERFPHLFELPKFCEAIPEPEAPAIQFKATPTTISKGERAILSWDVEHADSCRASGGWNGKKQLSGSHRVRPKTTEVYTLTCVNGNKETSASVTVTVSSTPVPAVATLTLINEVTNDNGGTALPTAWTLIASGTVDRISGVMGSSAVTQAAVTPGTYALSESDGPSDYVTSEFSCVKNGSTPVAGNTIMLAAGDSATCTIMNNDIVLVPTTGHLIVDKVTQPSGKAQAFSISISGTGTINGGAEGVVTDADGYDYEVAAGTYSVTETVPAGWVMVSNTCTGVTVAAGESKTCTITNAQLPTLTVVKRVINDNGGTQSVADFPLFIDGATTTSWATTTVATGTRTVSERNASGYTATFSGDCTANGQVTLALGDVKTCVITNDDVASTPVPTVSLTASPTNITQGASSTLTWSSANATQCVKSGGWSGTTAASGAVVVTPETTTTYTLACSGAGGVATSTATVTVTPLAAPSITFTATPHTISSGASSVLAWSVGDATSCTASGGWSGSKVTSGNASVTPSVTTDYVLSCVGTGGMSHATATVTVNQPAQTIGHIVISEVYYDVASTTTSASNDSSYEWVELYNGGGTAVSLTGWSVVDASSTTPFEPIVDSVTIQPGGFVIVAASNTPAGIPVNVPVVVLHSGIGSNGFSNTNDAALLRDPSGIVIDQIAWGAGTGLSPMTTPVGDGHSIARNQLTSDTDTATDWSDRAAPTPGQ